MTRFQRLMLLSLALVVVFHCQRESQPPVTTTTQPPTSTSTAPPPEPKEDAVARVTAPDPASNPCKKNSKPAVNSQRPLICIDDSDLSNITAYPDRAKALRSVVIEWWTVSGKGTISVDWKVLPSPTGLVACTSGTGYCKTMTSPSADGEHKYWVTLTKDGHAYTTHDPTIIIDTTSLIGSGVGGGVTSSSTTQRQ